MVMTRFLPESDAALAYEEASQYFKGKLIAPEDLDIIEVE